VEVAGLQFKYNKSQEHQVLKDLHIALDDPGRLGGVLQPGLTGTAVVVIEEKTLLQYFFRNLKRQYWRLLEGEERGPAQ